jgi:hypothetical protein
VTARSIPGILAKLIAKNVRISEITLILNGNPQFRARHYVFLFEVSVRGRPFLVTGPARVIDAGGNEFDTSGQENIALCRVLDFSAPNLSALMKWSRAKGRKIAGRKMRVRKQAIGEQSEEV